MFISKFNKLIRNRLLWGIFAFIDVISFVAWGTQTSSTRESKEAAGKLFGKPDPADKFRKEFFNTYLSMALMFGQPLKITEEINDLLRKLTWRRMAVMKTAQEMDLAVAPDEVTGTIEQQPFFVENGQFNRKRYEAFVASFLSKLGASEAQFEDQVREELIINKARMLVSQAVWVAPLEVAQAFALVYDTFDVSYVVLRSDEIRQKIKVGEDEARKYFEEHKEEFKVPEQVRVKYAAFPFDRYLDEKSITAEAMRAYYDENIEAYSTKTTNGWSDPLPFEDVKGKIKERLARENAVNTAADRALDFEVMLAPDRSGKAPTFEAAALTAGVSVATSKYFSLQEQVDWLDVGSDFNQAAFSLRMTDDDYFSHPVRGAGAYYVLGLEKRVEARIPEYEEVKDRVYAAAERQAEEEGVNDLALALRAAASKAVRDGKTLEQALAPTGVEVLSTGPFSAKTGFPDDNEDVVYALTKSIMAYNAGEMTELIPLKDGVAFAWIKSRTGADRSALASIRNDLGMYIRRKRAETVFHEWQEYLLKQAGFEDKVEKAKAAAVSGEDGEEQPEESP